MLASGKVQIYSLLGCSCPNMVFVIVSLFSMHQITSIFLLSFLCPVTNGPLRFLFVFFFFFFRVEISHTFYDVSFFPMFLSRRVDHYRIPRFLLLLLIWLFLHMPYDRDVPLLCLQSNCKDPVTDWIVSKKRFEDFWSRWYQQSLLSSFPSCINVSFSSLGHKVTQSCRRMFTTRSHTNCCALCGIYI